MFLLARSATAEDGTPLFSDVKNSNEIDLIMMHGLIPVFVSCKNGSVTQDELYKLNTVAGRFGGGYEKKMLIITQSKQGGSLDLLLERAREMQITVIPNAGSMSDEELIQQFRNLF